MAQRKVVEPIDGGCWGLLGGCGPAGVFHRMGALGGGAVTQRNRVVVRLLHPGFVPYCLEQHPQALHRIWIVGAGRHCHPPGIDLEGRG
eukprot:8693967-Pyramimonas_sp.AAC.1